jgi:hypothetical protein
MRLSLVRHTKTDNSTIGNLSIDDKFFSAVLEDTDRGLTSDMDIAQIKAIKVPKQTAIPTGEYTVSLKYKSPKFSLKTQYSFTNGYMPRLMNVPGYEGVLIHVGNSPEDTDGCLLLGDSSKPDYVVNSTATFKKFYNLLQAAEANNEDITIKIQ